MTIASSGGWWILSASSSVKVIACSSVVLALSDRLESWTLCTTLRYAFLDLDDWPVELSPMITLISLNGGYDDSSTLPFNFSSLWSCPRKLFNFPCLIRFSTCYLDQNTRSYYAYGLYGSDNIYSYCACWDLPSFSPATSRKDHPWFA